MTTQLLTVFERDRYSQFTPDEQAIFDETVKGMKEQFEAFLDDIEAVKQSLMDLVYDIEESPDDITFEEICKDIDNIDTKLADEIERISKKLEDI